MRRNLNVLAVGSRQMMCASLAVGLTLALVFLAEPALAQLVYHNGRWVDQRSLRSGIGFDTMQTMLRIGIVVASTGFGFLLGWLFSPEGRSARNAILLSAAGVAVLIIILNDGVLGWSLASTLAIVGFTWGLGFWLGRAAQSLMEVPTTFGSSLWANATHMVDKGLFGEQGIVLGTAMDGAYPKKFSYKGDRHLLTVAPTRSGKGISHIIPNLLKYLG